MLKNFIVKLFAGAAILSLPLTSFASFLECDGPLVIFNARGALAVNDANLAISNTTAAPTTSSNVVFSKDGFPFGFNVAGLWNFEELVAVGIDVGYTKFKLKSKSGPDYLDQSGINVGLRIEKDFAISSDGNWSLYTGATLGGMYLGTSGELSSAKLSQLSSYVFNVALRVGFSYSIGETIALRAGYNLFALPSIGEINLSSADASSKYKIDSRSSYLHSIELGIGASFGGDCSAM